MRNLSQPLLVLSLLAAALPAVHGLAGPVDERLAGAGAEGEEPGHEDHAALVGELDRDRDGRLSLAELAALDDEVDPAAMQEHFEAADRDQDGHIGAEELPAFIQLVEEAGDEESQDEEGKDEEGEGEEEQGAEDAMSHLDKDKDGKLSLEELTALDSEVPPAVLEKHLQAEDRDKDGHIGMDELPAFIQLVEQTGEEQDEEGIMSDLDKD